MPQVALDTLKKELRGVIGDFKAAYHPDDEHIPLSDLEVVYTFADPERSVEQGVLSIFKAGQTPMIVMVMEKRGDKVDIYASKVTDERVEIFYKGNIFSDLENNYMTQPVWLSTPKREDEPGQDLTLTKEDVTVSDEDLRDVSVQGIA